MKPKSTLLKILLAEDDKDDSFFFNKALAELPISTELTLVHDGEELMSYLFDNIEQLPNVLFLDLNMPRKTGFECLTEIKQNEKLKKITVILFSTSYTRDLNYEKDIINMLYDIGAYHFIRKPFDFKQLKESIRTVILQLLDDKND